MSVISTEELKKEILSNVSSIPDLLIIARKRGVEKDCLDAVREAVKPFQTHVTTEAQSNALGAAAYIESKYGGSPDHALLMATESLRVHPNVFAQLARGISAQQKEDIPSAVTAFRAAVDISTSDVDLSGECWNRLGTILMVQKQYSLALVALQNAVSMRPNDAASHIDVAECLMHNRLWKAAVSEYNTACKLVPDNPEYQAQRATALATTAATEAEYAAAVSAMKQVLSHSPDDLGSKLRLSGLHARFLRLNEAKRLLEQCLGASAEFSDGWHNLAAIYERLGDRVSMQAAHARFEELMAKKVTEADHKRSMARAGAILQ